MLQVHDFAQTIKECEKQVKQLEIATTGTNCVSVVVCSVTIFEHVTCKYRDYSVAALSCLKSTLLNVLAAVFKATADTLARPLPHVYQADPQGTAQPIVPSEELRQEAATTMGTAGMQNSVRVQDLTSISQKHVCHCLH